MENLNIKGINVYDYLLRKYAAGLITVNVSRSNSSEYVDLLKNTLDVKEVISFVANTSHTWAEESITDNVGCAYVFKVGGVDSGAEAYLTYVNTNGNAVTETIKTGNAIVCIEKGNTINQSKWILVTDETVEVTVDNKDATFGWNNTVIVANVQGTNITLKAPGDPALNTVGQVTYDSNDVLESGTPINGSAKKKLRLPVLYVKTVNTASSGDNRGFYVRYYNASGTEVNVCVANAADFQSIIGLNSIMDVIPPEASSTNQLADKAFVNAAIGGDTPSSATNITYSELKAKRDGGTLSPGQFYRITDYVTTVNPEEYAYARSAGHQFDIIVRADSEIALNEQAWAIQHEGDTYFAASNLQAWELKYTLDSIYFSMPSKVITVTIPDQDTIEFYEYDVIVLGGHTYKRLWVFDAELSFHVILDSLEVGETVYGHQGKFEEFDPSELIEIGTITSIVDPSPISGKGTITWMKDEWGNECPYDFKNIQFKRFKGIDENGDRGFSDEGNLYYILADLNNLPSGIITQDGEDVIDPEDFIWAYTFSSDPSGGEQEDFSVDGFHQVRENKFEGNQLDSCLSNNVMFGEDNMNNVFGGGCSNNTSLQHFVGNVFTTYCKNNVFGVYFQRNKVGEINQISFGQSCCDNTIGYNVYQNIFGNDCTGNTFGNNIYWILADNDCKNVQVLNNVRGSQSQYYTLGGGQLLYNRDFVQIIYMGDDANTNYIYRYPYNSQQK